KAIIIRNNGDSSQLRVEDVPIGDPAPQQIQVKQLALGINDIDINFRKGIYDAKLPFIPGIEASGIVLKVGRDIKNISEGEKVAYVTGPVGSYRTLRNIDFKDVISIPDDLDLVVVAGFLYKAMMAQTLIRRAHIVLPDTWLLVHDVTGPYGNLIAQWADGIKAYVIGTVDHVKKVPIAKKFGCKYVINLAENNWLDKIMEITQGKGVPVVFDNLGQAVYEQSIKSLGLFGTYVSYGQKTGFIPPVDIRLLSKKSLLVTRPNMKHYKRNRVELIRGTQEVFDALNDRLIQPIIGKIYNGLEEVSLAHDGYESSKLIGSAVVKLPE
ncbi:MAG: quinone oxidoreductase, partial [Pseudomonadota bacterium]